ncbi:neutral/alkaline non-lysosomal ceramidase N-terminal domain-containing protein [Halorientalis halophila]|uniref:neutral/alkaline non-lysosomal ceramidase N-terminal domain-containing protein n=1 Tax=Halorientalis halophila TaxID=3108499 RepID=UPI00300959C1
MANTGGPGSGAPDRRGAERGVSNTLDRRRFVQATALAGLATGLASGESGSATSGGALTASAARRDITPENGGSFFGYVRPDMRAEGVAIRLFAHALVLSDGERKVALVSADLGKPAVRDRVIEHVRPQGFDRDSVLFAATHTHAGPNEPGEWIAGQIGDAIAAADANRRPARAGWASGTVEEGNWNRSLAAHLANFDLEVPIGEAEPEDHPVDPDRARDTTVRLLRVEGTDGTPICAWTLFGNHPTAFTPSNTTFSADFPGVAREWFARRFDDGDAPVTVYTTGRVGDQIPRYDDYGQYAVAERTAIRIERAMWDAWRNAGGDLSRDLPVDGRATQDEYVGQEVEPGKRVADDAIVGLPTLDGGENGPTPFSGLELEGKRKPEWLADDVHGRKILLAPAPYSTDVEVQAMRIGDEMLVTVPGEPTVEMGRRMREAAESVAPDGVETVSVVGIANGYNGYFTTPQEYDVQDYEGGNTAFGKYTSLLIRNRQEDLAGALAERVGEPSEPTGSRPAVPDAPVGDGGDDGAIETQPPETVERMDVVTLEWRGGWSGKDRPVGDPFVSLERRTGGGWETVTSDLGLGFVWTAFWGHYTARYDVPPDLPTGTYRFRVQAANYELPSRAFEVVPSRGLRVRGVRVADGSSSGEGDGTRLAFVAQNPPPDPDENLRVRPIRPTGGLLAFSAAGQEHEARWDKGAEAWIATVSGVAAGDVVTVPENGLVDGLGNRNGKAVDLRVGSVAELDWPETMGTGGGDPPGLFGIGSFPT